MDTCINNDSQGATDSQDASESQGQEAAESNVSKRYDDSSCKFMLNSQFSETNSDSQYCDNLKIISLNVCGLKSKQNCPDFFYH